LFLKYAYIVFIGLAFITSLAALYRASERPAHLRLFSVLLGLTFVVECFAALLFKPLHWGSNVPLYNSFMLVEFMAYAWYYHMILKTGWARQLARLFLFLFPPFWAWVVFWVFGILHWNSYVVVAGSVFTIFVSAAYYYEIFTRQADINLLDTPEFWIATGLLIFYACNLPYIGMLNYLVKNYMPLAKTFLVILKILNILMYSIFTYAFICRIPIKKSSSSS